MLPFFLRTHRSSLFLSTSRLNLSAWFERSSKVWSYLTLPDGFPLASKWELSIRVGLSPPRLLCANCCLPVFVHSASLLRKVLPICPPSKVRTVFAKPRSITAIFLKASFTKHTKFKKVLPSSKCIYRLIHIWLYLFCIMFCFLKNIF